MIIKSQQERSSKCSGETIVEDKKYKLVWREIL